MRLPPAIFESALREAEALAPFLEAGEEAFVMALRAECARRGWVQQDKEDFESWTFHEVAGFDNTSTPRDQR